jgi:endo-1,4-beta-mannosidase
MAVCLILSAFLFPSEEVKGADYYPSQHSWERMWLEWDSSAIAQELGLAKELNLNVIETYVHYPFFFSEESSRIRTELADRMGEFLEIADRYGLKVIYTLFDFAPNHSLARWKLHKGYLEGIVERFKDDERIYLWGIRNEINSIGEPSDTLIAWAESVATFIRRNDTLHPLELEFSGSGLGFLEKSASPFIERLKDRVDAFALSFYGDPESLPPLIHWLRGKSGKPVMVSEFGYPTSRSGGEEGQREYYERMLKVLKRTKTGFRFWTLLDFTAKHLSAKERSLGVFSADYRPKSSCAVLKKLLKD